MKKLFCFFFIFFLLASGTAKAQTPEIDAKAAVLMEVSTGLIIYAKNENTKLPMASTTKVMTLLLAVERGNLSDIVTVSKNASGVEGSSMYLEVGEKITLENLLYGLMLVSGNDAAVAIAEHIGGSVSKFVSLMNERAKQLGASNTHFVTPNGLHNDDHYTTAYDLALIASTAIQNPTVQKIITTASRTVEWEGHKWDRVLKNKNKFLKSYEGSNGFKTGFTKNAGRCFVSAANKNGLQLVGVVLNCSDMYNESAEMMDYGFSEIKMDKIISAGEMVGKIKVKNGSKKDLEIYVKGDIIIPIRLNGSDKMGKNFVLPEYVDAPVVSGQVVGKVEVLINGNVIASQQLCTVESVEETSYCYYLKKIIGNWRAAS